MEQYTLPGVLHFLNAEWRRFERDRNEWGVEKEALKAKELTEDQAQVARLLGENQALDTKNTDLTRRANMLEFALRTERKKFLAASAPADCLSHSLDDARLPDSVVPAASESPVLPNIPASVTTATSIPQQQLQPTTTASTASPQVYLAFSKGLGHTRSREILKNYLREANYLLSHSNMPPVSLSAPSVGASAGGTFSTSPSSHKRHNKNTNVGDLVDDIEDENDIPVEDDDDESELRFRARSSGAGSHQQEYLQQQQHQQHQQFQPKVSILKKNNSASSSSSAASSTVKRKHPRRDLSSDSSSVATTVELANGHINPRMDDIVVTDDDHVPSSTTSLPEDDTYDSTPLAFDEHQTKIWKPKASLTSHLDSIRSIAFLPPTSSSTTKALLSASEDGTAKLWVLNSLYTNTSIADHRKTITPKADLEPVFTFRGHVGAVTALTVTKDGDAFYTGGTDSSIRFWALKDNGRDLVLRDTYSTYSGLNPQKQLIVSHTDTVWDMQLNDTLTTRSPCLATASADGTVKIFDAGDRTSHRLLNTIKHVDESTHRVLNPTSVAWVPSGLGKTIAISYQDSGCRVVDVETGKVVVAVESRETFDGTFATQINKIVLHPTLPLLISAHEDRFIRFFDINSGTCVHSMLGHQNAVTSLSISPSSSGLQFASSGHDCSLRWWDIGTRTCVQEYSTHRKKNDEGIWDIAYLAGGDDERFASAGADGAVKLFNKN
ncbi:UNVERIFIED_CONTAM: hypothetical protein HDU68_010566 [Siphonaria sp. JEL0065]|nr:hypothetical protein HDU68_010566 [Siphonaria sp. JEL0065]